MATQSPRIIQARKKNPNPNFLVRIFSSGVGVFHMNGWGPKSSIRPSKPGKSNFLGGISRDFAGISRGCPKSLRKKKSLCSISVSSYRLGRCQGREQLQGRGDGPGKLRGQSVCGCAIAVSVIEGEQEDQMDLRSCPPAGG